ncbi:3'-5' exonuclease [Paenibacillus sinopodophylli]|uniref:3'-5' exonuclease n=1 Tax=Paenibacillus sinopodophylli TaxID=1837342 RepID=UPI001FE3FD27|nr:3'-5' exonuclease [Paenibacillus sinopodophylli]
MMAYMIPEVIRTSATAGERLVFRTLKTYLAEDYVVYYEPEIAGDRPDFVIIGPDLGLLVLDVKDYTRSSLFQIGVDEWQIHSSAGRMEVVDNPYKLARDKSRHIARQLKDDPQLAVQREGQAGMLKFACGHGTVFTRMELEDFERLSLCDVISPSFVLCRDEIDADREGFSADLLIEKIHGMFTDWSRKRVMLTLTDMQSIRSHLHPEVRLSTEYRPLGDEQDQLLLSLHQIEAMNVQQELAAMLLSVDGSAAAGIGSQSLMLVNRAKIMAKLHPEWKILILSRSHTISGSLVKMVDELMKEPEDLFDWVMLEEQKGDMKRKHNVEVYYFHEWLSKALNIREAGITGLIEKLESREAILPAYDAILIDKGEQFDREWIKLLNQLLIPGKAAGSSDNKESSRILSVNYRNTAQIVQFAWRFYQQHSLPGNKLQEGAIDGVTLIPPHSTRRKGPEPAILRCRNLQEELEAVVKRIQYLHTERKVPYGEMAILYRVKNNYYSSYIDLIRKELRRQGFPFHWLSDEGNAGAIQTSGDSSDAIVISSVDDARGNDYRAVFLVNTENMPYALEEAEERETAKFYMALTRALDWLFISYSGDSRFTLYLDEIQQQRKEKKPAAKKMG